MGELGCEQSVSRLFALFPLKQWSRMAHLGTTKAWPEEQRETPDDGALGRTDQSSNAGEARQPHFRSTASRPQFDSRRNSCACEMGRGSTSAPVHVRNCRTLSKSKREPRASVVWTLSDRKTTVSLETHAIVIRESTIDDGG